MNESGYLHTMSHMQTPLLAIKSSNILFVHLLGKVLHTYIK